MAKQSRTTAIYIRLIKLIKERILARIAKLDSKQQANWEKARDQGAFAIRVQEAAEGWAKKKAFEAVSKNADLAEEQHKLRDSL